MLLNSLVSVSGNHKKKKLLGRGPGSGHGKTSTRGHKGQKSRAGRDFYMGFEGGQSPLIRRVPKRGFTHLSKREYQLVNLKDLAASPEATITPETLKKQGIIRNKNFPVKILGEGDLKSALTVKANKFSKCAIEKIQGAGGKIEIISSDKSKESRKPKTRNAKPKTQSLKPTL